MKKLFFIPFVFAIFILGYYFGVSFSEQKVKVNPSSKVDLPSFIDEVIIVDLMIDYQDGRVETYNNITMDKDYTVFDLLRTTLENNEVNFIYDDGNLGAFIKQIGDKENDYGALEYWQYWINGEYAKVGASSYVLQDGDMIEWKYIKGQVDN